MKRLTAILAAIVLALVAVVPTTAHGTHSIGLHQDFGGPNTNTKSFADSSLYTGDTGWGCASGGTHAVITYHWDNCVSSVHVTLSSGTCVVLYQYADWTGNTYAIHGPRSNSYHDLWAAGFNNQTSSLRFGTINWGGYCTSPWH